MTPEEMATLHARAFGSQGRSWSVDEFAALIRSAHVFASGDARAFALAHVVADEAELLTIATDPGHRRTGLAQAVLSRVEDRAARQGAARLILEVAEDNLPAQGLYHAAGYREIARRPAYYLRPNGAPAEALVLEKGLG